MKKPHWTTFLFEGCLMAFLGIYQFVHRSYAEAAIAFALVSVLIELRRWGKQ